MTYVNKVILIGRLGRDPEVRRTVTGTPVARFSLATDEVWIDRNGEKQQRTEWHNIVAWNRLAERCEQFLSKGKLVYIEGRLQTREYDDRDGNRRRITEIVATDMRMLGPREEERDLSSDLAADQASSPGIAQDPLNITDEDIPF